MERSGGEGSSQVAAAATAKPVTTFVQLDSTCFREVVQRLTGPTTSSSSSPSSQHATIEPGSGLRKKPTASRLHERRHHKNSTKLQIVKPPAAAGAADEWRSPVMMLSPTSLTGGTWDYYPSAGFLVPIINSPSSNNMPTIVGSNKRGSARISSPSSSQSPSWTMEIDTEEEEKAIKERRFYLHQSPRSKPAGHFISEPELLTLFPLTSSTATTTNKP